MPEKVKNSNQHYEALFLSDFHMGSRHFHAASLLTYFDTVSCDRLYLVGDIFDGWKLSKKWYWPENYTAVFAKIIEMQNAGTKVIFITGNHDEKIRFLNIFFKMAFEHKFKIPLKDKDVLKSSDGKRYLISHGDEYDRAIMSGAISHWAHWLYSTLDSILPRRPSPKIRIGGVFRKFSLAKMLRTSGLYAKLLINNFENAVCRTLKQQGFDGYICGHTHIPALKTLKNGRLYANSGSWCSQKNTALTFNNNVFDLMYAPRIESYNIPDTLKQTKSWMTALEMRDIAQSLWYRPKGAPSMEVEKLSYWTKDLVTDQKEFFDKLKQKSGLKIPTDKVNENTSLPSKTSEEVA